jgi:opacity protein-like surface antigen
VKHILSFLLVVALLAAMTTPAVASQPDNYCTTVTVQATATGYDVTATGAGRYARVRDLTDATTVIATDFGSGATAYQWQDLALDTTHQYQVQVSHTSLTTGFSTIGCLFTPPVYLGVVMASFTGTANGSDVVLEWETMTEWHNLGWNVYRGTADDHLQAALIAHVPSVSPGGTIGPWQYTYTDSGLAPGTYWYWLRDVPVIGLGEYYGPVVVTVEAPSAVSLTTFAAATSPATGCYMRRGICVCAGPQGKLYRAPKLACSIWRS